MIPDHIASVASKHGLESAALAALAEIESGGKSFGPDGRALILYEPHVAYRCARPGARDLLMSLGLAWPKWRPGVYPREQADRWRQFEDCARVAGRDVAIMACSWGYPQVLGEGWRMLELDRPEDVEKLAGTVEGQTELMARFVLGKRGLRAALTSRDWREVARLYNGPGQVDRYAPRLEAAYRRITGSTSPVVLRLGDRGSAVGELQRALDRAGYYDGPVDSVFGPGTEAAVERFQTSARLPVDGVVGARTWKELAYYGGEVTPPAQPAVAAARADAARPVADVAAGAAVVAAGSAVISNPQAAQGWSEALGVPVIAVVLGAAALVTLAPRILRRLTQ